MWVLICLGHLTVCSHHVTHLFQSESTIFSFPNLKDVLPINRRDNERLSECRGSQTHNQLVRKWTINYLIKLATWLSCYQYKSLLRIWLYVHIILHTRLRLNSHFIVTFKMRSCPLERRAMSEDWTTATRLEAITAYLTKKAKWFSCVLSTNLYGAFDCMLLLCQVGVSELIHTP